MKQKNVLFYSCSMTTWILESKVISDLDSNTITEILCPSV